MPVFIWLSILFLIYFTQKSGLLCFVKEEAQFFSVASQFVCWMIWTEIIYSVF